MKVKLYLCGAEPKRMYSQYSLGLGYLLSNVKADVEVVTNSEQLTDCDLIGLSANAHGVAEAISIREKVSIPIVIGGQSTLWPELTSFGFDHVVVGEGERALQKVIDGDATGYMHEELIEDIDTLEFPERGKVQALVPLLSSRGCPFNCAFCSSQEYWGKVRFHSADYFMAEVKHLLMKYPHMKTVYLMDDLFIANKTRFNMIYDQWLSAGYDKRLRLRGFIRSSIFTMDTALKMKRMGFGTVRFGAESGSNRVLALLNKQATVEDHQRAIGIANEIKLPISASFMHSIPGETQEDVRLTKEFIGKNKGKLKVEGYYRFVAFPGTAFYRGADLLTEDMRVR